MLFLLGVVLIAIGIGVSIALHELGHLLTAKKFGVKTTEYMIGFGPTIWSTQRGETRYGLKAIPLGGYCRMIGMFPPADGEEVDEHGNLRVRASSTGRFSQMIDEARSAASEEVGPEDHDRVFYKLPTHKKIIVMAGGTFMNLLLAAVLLIGLACGVGLPKQVTVDVGGVQQCLPTDPTASTTECAADQRSPGAKAGLKAGDRILSVDGTSVSTNIEATRIIRANANTTIPLVIERDGARRTVQVTPAPRRMQAMDSEGTPVVDWKGDPVMSTVGLLGVGLGGTSEYRREPLSAGPGIVWDAFERTASVFLKIPQKMVGVANAAFSDGERDRNGPVSVVGVGRIAGEVTNVDQIPVRDKAALLISIIAALNMALFVFNLVPLLPLDGGHVVTAVWEAIKRRLARARGVEGPVYADAAKGMPIAYVVSLVLIVMFVLLAYADLVNPITLVP